MNKFYKFREFDIVDNLNRDVDACAQFTYKGYKVSLSTVGRSKGACHNHVCIFHGEDFQNVFKDGFSTVEVALKYIEVYLEEQCTVICPECGTPGSHFISFVDFPVAEPSKGALKALNMQSTSFK